MNTIVVLCELFQLQELFLFTWLYHSVYVWGRKNKNATDKVKTVKFYHTDSFPPFAVYTCQIIILVFGLRCSLFHSDISFPLLIRHDYPAVHVRRRLFLCLITECDWRMMTIICHQISQFWLSVSKSSIDCLFPTGKKMICHKCKHLKL